MIAEWRTEELRGALKDYRVEWIGYLLSAIVRMDLVNRAKNGRVIPTQIESLGSLTNWDELTPALIKNRSNLAKIIQLTIIAFDASVQNKDFAKTLAGVDGDIERFTMQGLTQVIKAIKMRQEFGDLKRDINQNMRSWPLKAIGVDIETAIRNKSDVNETLRATREMSVDISGDNLIVKSYGQESYVDLKSGKIIFGWLLSWKEYPLTVQLVRDRDNKNAPLFIESEVNRENIKKAMKLMNLVHFIVKEFMNNERKHTIRDMEKPFYVVGGNIALDNGFFIDVNIVKRKTLESILMDVRTNTSESPEILARFLNDIFRSKYPQDRKSVV